ncbi:hypothetical protein HPC62_12020 [Thermoleptolyngbya sichuanensis A183]|uniref:Uncharacterized protein n=1 Tax=Thermoleptolyngbya sichuanensis A183 TaxID=2737172 RepID=A0A6M8BD81_9CYAN|nr:MULTISPECIES: hypothetical protein [Thermoleptolyngbya]QKD82817.1 hypothetical protein HPC62_12020 [Thermoleptolyngbya sichuanensis A183]
MGLVCQKRAIALARTSMFASVQTLVDAFIDRIAVASGASLVEPCHRSVSQVSQHTRCPQ